MILRLEICVKKTLIETQSGKNGPLGQFNTEILFCKFLFQLNERFYFVLNNNHYQVKGIKLHLKATLQAKNGQKRANTAKND
jgi:hypothetical protein